MSVMFTVLVQDAQHELPLDQKYWIPGVKIEKRETRRLGMLESSEFLNYAITIISSVSSAALTAWITDHLQGRREEKKQYTITKRINKNYFHNT